MIRSLLMPLEEKTINSFPLSISWIHLNFFCLMVKSLALGDFDGSVDVIDFLKLNKANTLMNNPPTTRVTMINHFKIETLP